MYEYSMWSIYISEDGNKFKYEVKSQILNRDE